jgi:hypothetical protein
MIKLEPYNLKTKLGKTIYRRTLNNIPMWRLGRIPPP